MTRIYVAVLFSFGILVTSGCDKGKALLASESLQSYSSCLQSAVSSGNHLSADDIRALCAEATGVTEPTYKFGEKELTPSNEFTRCYDKEKKELEARGLSQATRLAKLSCKYPNVK